MSVAEAARFLDVSASTVRRRIERGEQRALREIVDGRTRVWVLFAEETAERPEVKLPDVTVPAPPTSSGVERSVASSAGAVVSLEGRRRAPVRVIPPTDWVVGWALRAPRTLDWVAPSGTSRPRMTASLDGARVHGSREAAATYARWLPVDVVPAEVAVGAEHAHLDESLRRAG